MLPIKVEDLFRRLSYGPLSNLSLAKEGAGEIKEESQGKIVDYINDGLLRLYSRFLLKEAQLILQTIEGLTRYELAPKYGQAAHLADEDLDTPVYILDALEPFQSDLIKVLEVFDTEGRRVHLNNAEEPSSVFTPRPSLLQVPYSVNVMALSLIYQAKHVKLEYDEPEAEILLPDCLHSALLAYVASEVFSHMNGPENSAKGQEHLAKFDRLCNEALENDLVSTSTSTTNSNFEKRGWI